MYILYKALPVSNSVDAAAGGMTDEQRMWTVDSYLAANLFDAVQQLTYVTQVVNSPKGKKPQKPKPHPRPRQRATRAAPPLYPGKTVYVK